MLPLDSSSVLTAVARLAAEAATLTELVPRLAAIVREVIPFERLHVLRLDRAESIVLYVVRADGELEVTGHRIADTKSVGEPAVAGDARSRIICSVGRGSSVSGALWFTSSQPHAFSAAHQVLMDGVADLLALVLQQDAMRSTESLRRERIDTLDRLLNTMAGALDIRHIFADVSASVRGGLPHDILLLTAWAGDGKSFRVYAMAGAQVDDSGFWAPTILTGEERALLHRDPYVVRDVGAEIAAGSVRGRIFARLDVRSALRVPMPLSTGVFGSLFFLARETERFSESDLDFARRVADLLALALSHQRLAEAARRDTAAREMAAQLEAQVATLTRELEAKTGHRRIVGRSPQWTGVLAQAARVAQTETTVLLTGESGTGKEVVARFIHQGSRRKHGPFIAINCAALPDQLLESELFGYERGAFTGAMSAKPGRIEQANGGVLFLDEVGEMVPAVQAKLLRVLEEREFQRLGSTHLSRADIWVVAATNQRPARGHASQGVPRGPLLPAWRVRDCAASAEGSAGRHSRVGRRVSGGNRRHGREAPRRDRPRREGSADRLRVAWERAGTAQCDRTGGDSRRRRLHPERAPPGHRASSSPDSTRVGRGHCLGATSCRWR